jgi:DNA-binding NarL/FixJ family response regulator
MKHCFIDRQSGALPTWREAMPQARFAGRGELAGCKGDGIFWFRLRAGEKPSDILPSSGPLAGQYFVLLADEPDEETVLQALAAGAAGCCNSYAAPEVLQQVALVVANGGLWIGQSLLRRVVDNSARILERQAAVAHQEEWSGPLSEREVQVARLVAEARSNKEIANQLSISERTVKAHLTSIFEKLGLRDRLQLSLRINGLPL